MRCRAKADTCMPKSTSDFMARATLLFSLLVASGAVASGSLVLVVHQPVLTGNLSEPPPEISS